MRAFFDRLARRGKSPSRAASESKDLVLSEKQDEAGRGGSQAPVKEPTLIEQMRPERRYWNETPKARAGFEFILEPEIAQRFNAYAQAALPYEIGGLLRIERDGTVFRATDIAIFEQKATASYFELDPAALAAWQLEMVRSGRRDELGEWRSLIHSHPQMAPFPSAVDVENVTRLAGDRWAFSVICSAHPDPNGNYYSVHYAQGGEVPFFISCLDVGCPRGQSLAGTDLLDAEQLAAISASAAELCQPMPHPVRRTRTAIDCWLEVAAGEEQSEETSGSRESILDELFAEPDATDERWDDEGEREIELLCTDHDHGLSGDDLDDDLYELVDRLISDASEELVSEDDCALLRVILDSGQPFTDGELATLMELVEVALDDEQHEPELLEELYELLASVIDSDDADAAGVDTDRLDAGI